MRTVEKKQRVNLGLELLMLVAIPGRPLTRRDVAAWCGCTGQAISRIERAALLKLANRIQFGRRELREVFAYHVGPGTLAARRPGRKRAA